MKLNNKAAVICLGLVTFLNIVCQAENVTFKKLTSYNRGGRIFSIDQIESQSINVLKTTIFLISPFRNHSDDWYTNLTDQLFEKDNFNVFIVTWDVDQGQAVQSQVEAAGGALGDFMQALIYKTGERYIDYHLVGAAEGAVVGLKGAERLNKLTGRNVNRLTELDPSCSLITEEAAPEKYVNFVDAIHSNAKRNGGKFETFGQVDFYVYDKNQDGTSCDPMKAVEYFTNSVTTNKYQAVKCASLDQFLADTCEANEKATFGENVNKKTSGIYILDVASDTV